MALVDDRTMTMAEREGSEGDGLDGGRRGQKKVFLVAAFQRDDSGQQGPAAGMAEDVVAVIGMAGDQQRFEWVGADQADSIQNPALVTPVKVRLALPSPWHRPEDTMVTGLVQLDAVQLGDGPVDEDIDHLVAELAKSRAPGRDRSESA